MPGAPLVQAVELEKRYVDGPAVVSVLEGLGLEIEAGERVAVARALVQRPRLLLADEPTGNLDPATGEGVQQLLIELNREHGSSLVVATHNARLAAAIGRTLRLAGGRLREEHAPPLTRIGR